MDNYQLYNNLPVGIFVINPDYEIIFWNNMIEHFSGKSSSEMVGKNLLEIYPHLNKNMYRFRIEQIFMGGPPAIFSSQLHKYIIPCKLINGKLRRQHSTVSGIASKTDKVSNAVFSIQDITEESKRIEEYREMRKQALDEIEKRKVVEKALMESNLTKDKFFSIISHDLKNPFVTLLGFTEMLLDDLKNFTTEEMEIYLSEMHKVAKSTYSLLEDLLLWSRSQRDTLELNRVNLNLFECASQTIATLDNIAKRKEIEIKNKITEGFEIYADQNSINTVLRNLISNAIKFTTANGTIRLDASLVNEEAFITVSDTGVGIKESRLEEIFQIGAHTSTEGTEQEKGTGLGLVLCREFIEKHGGKIWVESEVGKGSKFIISLPIKK